MFEIFHNKMIGKATNSKYHSDLNYYHCIIYCYTIDLKKLMFSLRSKF